MKNIKTCAICFFAFCITASVLPLTSWAGDIPGPWEYAPTWQQRFERKAPYDDPRPYLKTHGPEQVLPAALWEKLSYDVDTMKERWAEAVGFRAQDVVGKIATEIKPGRYTYKDKEKFPGLKELMIPLHYDKYFLPGGPPHGGNFPEFEVVPTRQYYYSLPITEATIKNMGKTRLDKDGYIIQESWVAGFPFPKPSGKFKAQQIMWNIEKRYINHGLNFINLGTMQGFTKNLVMDFDGHFEVRHITYAGRVLLPPYGWLDERAEKRGELNSYIMMFHRPRDVAGFIQLGLRFQPLDTLPQTYMYIPSLRRVRKLTATDTQDPVLGLDWITDDNEGWNQKLSPTRYSYKYELIEEREFLIPAPTWDGSEYFSSEGLEQRGLKFERRPLYVLKLTQLDPNYVYSYRIVYIDKETFVWYHVQSYDQKGRLYRTFDLNYGFEYKMGALTWGGALNVWRDWVDLHTTLGQSYQFPAAWERKDISLRSLVKGGK